MTHLLRMRWLFLGLGTGALVLQLAETVVVPRSPDLIPRPTLLLVASLCAGAAAVLASLLPVERRRLRLLVASGIALYSLGEISPYAFTGKLTSYPTPSDILWLSLYVLALITTFLILRALHPRLQLTMWLDSAIVGVVTVGAIYELVIRPLVNGPAADGLTLGQGLYPLLDLATLAVLLILALGTGRLGANIRILVLGFVVLLATDIANVKIVAANGYEPDALLNCGWPAALLLLAGALQSRNALVAAGPLHGRRFGWTVSLAALVSTFLFVRAVVRDDVLACAVFGLVPLLVVLRLTLTQRENERLADDNLRILEAVGTGIMRCDAAGVITFVNAIAASVLGWEAHELIGRPGHATVHHSHPGGVPFPQDECSIQQAVRGGRTIHTQGEVFWRKDGTPVPVTYTCSPMREDGAIAGAVVVFDDLAGDLRAASRIRHNADRDPLTGLPNRSRLPALVAESLARSAGRSSAFAIVDLDALQFVNDSFGHAAGDGVICQVAAVLKRELGVDDVVGRLGADEFAVLMHDVEPHDADGVLNCLRDAIRDGTEPRIDSSVGFVAVSADDETVADDLMIAADIALYEAKEQGGGRVIRYEGVKGATLTRVERVREALANDRFALYAQPIVDVRTGRCAREELLVRMIGDDGEVIPPGEFLPTAERFGLINDLDHVVVSKALRAAAAGHRVAINLSGRTLGDASVIRMVADAIAEGTPPERISFEITETSANTNLDAAAAFATELRQLGCALALDDFGTGFGSFVYLRRLPVDTIKIDMEFVRDLTQRGPDYHLVRALVALAHSLGQTTVAEGVEDEETMDLLREIGVDYAQGYHVGRPAPLSVIAASLSTAA